VRKALKIAAADAGCDFVGFGLHSFRRANITMRQEEGGSAIGDDGSGLSGVIEHIILALATQWGICPNDVLRYRPKQRHSGGRPRNVTVTASSS
jgi:hypothetical protein